MTARRTRVRSETPATYDAPMLAAAVDAAEDAIIRQALAIMDRRAKQPRGESFTDPAKAGTYCRLALDSLDREHFMVLFLDTRHRLIKAETLFMGGLDSAEVHQRVIVKAALTHNAAAVIVAHNHPSGDPTPSAADRACIARLKQALALVDVRLLDSIIVGDGPALSMAARGMV